MLPEKKHMIKRFFSALLVGSTLAGASTPQPRQFLVGRTQVIPPSGWQLLRTETDSLVFQTTDERQQATISVMQLVSTATFEEFKHFCDVRVANERKFLTDGFIEPKNPTPFKDGDTFGMFYSGADRKSGRVFSANFSLKRGELVTVYVEGLGVSSNDHLQSFKAFVAGTKFVGGTKTK